MEIKFALNISDKVRNVKSVFDELEHWINSTIFQKDYGKDLQEIYIGWICVSPEFDQFFKPRKPRYYSEKQMSVDGHNYFLNKALELEIKLDFVTVGSSNLTEVYNIIYKALIEALRGSINADKKIQDFDSEQLILDLDGNIRNINS